MSKRELIGGICIGLVFGAIGCYLAVPRYELVRASDRVVYRINTHTGRSWFSLVASDEWEEVKEPKAK
jgi:hypothetical protein